MADSRAQAVYVANIIAPREGACFRYVHDNTRGGYPMPCPEPVAFRGIVRNPKGKRLAVQACTGHAGGLAERQAIT
jgi:hypothetical protein